jgi:hypothetical protein
MRNRLGRMLRSGFNRVGAVLSRSRAPSTVSLEEQQQQMIDRIDEQVLNAYLQEMHSNSDPEIDFRTWTHQMDKDYRAATRDPLAFADRLMGAAQLDNITNETGGRIISDDLIARIKRMMVPELVSKAVNQRNASYLLELAGSRCTAQWLTSTEGTISGHNRMLQEAQESEVEGAREDIIRLTASFCLNVALILLDGIDIANWENFYWPSLDQDLLETRAVVGRESPAVTYIRSFEIKPANVKNDPVARRRFSECSQYFRERYPEWKHSEVLRHPLVLPGAQRARPAAQMAGPEGQMARPEGQMASPAAQMASPEGQMARPAAQMASPAAQMARPAAQLMTNNTNVPDEYGTMPVPVPRQFAENVPDKWGQLPPKGGRKTRRSKRRLAKTRRSSKSNRSANTRRR